MPKNHLNTMLFSLVAFFTLLCSALCVERTLIVYDSQSVSLDDAPGYLRHLVSRFRSDNQTLVLRGYQEDDLYTSLNGEQLFENVIILPTAAKKIVNKDHFNKHQLLKMVDDNVNLIFVGNASANYPDEVREVLNEVGIFPSPKGYKLVDYFEENDVVKLGKKNILASRIVSEIEGDYEGQAAILNNNELLVPIVKASKTAVSTNGGVDAVDGENYWAVGEQNFLAVALQALHGGRLTWVGDISLLTDEVVEWATQKGGVVKLQFVQHHKADEPENLNNTLYRIKDEVTYVAGVSELVDGQWKPFVATGDDTLQLAFRMLDPYVRINLEPLGPTSSTENGPDDTYVYYTTFTVPDRHGMFTFELDYKRPGLNFLEDKKVVAVRHLANDEYKRSWEITNSWFYVASAVFVVGGWFLFVMNFLYVSKTNQEKKQQ